MFAVIKTGGKQYRVAAEDKLKVEKVAGEPGEIIQFGEVLVVGGDSVTLGQPDRFGRLGRGRSAGSGPRPQGHRVQEAPAQEFAPQARPPAGIHAGPDHRDPDRRREAHQGGRPKRETKPRSARTAAKRRDETPKPKTKAKPGEGGPAEAGGEKARCGKSESKRQKK